ncbi:hypothetical protein EJ08DRAFT_252456 [Tothia fuscella]|uniref:Uncharacterized protein n=1 Tax=Tothia fuscella TaxID=1048955 RepID=A0A9P4NRS5_9PEZI|nr:hypothetical protein EJ08DRAFT_252456 [Tothia fuscella]
MSDRKKKKERPGAHVHRSSPYDNDDDDGGTTGGGTNTTTQHQPEESMTVTAHSQPLPIAANGGYTQSSDSYGNIQYSNSGSQSSSDGNYHPTVQSLPRQYSSSVRERHVQHLPAASVYQQQQPAAHYTAQQHHYQSPYYGQSHQEYFDTTSTNYLYQGQQNSTPQQPPEPPAGTQHGWNLCSDGKHEVRINGVDTLGNQTYEYRIRR